MSRLGWQRWLSDLCIYLQILAPFGSKSLNFCSNLLKISQHFAKDVCYRATLTLVYHVACEELNPDRFITERRAHLKQKDGASEPEKVNFLHSVGLQFTVIWQDMPRNHFLTSLSKFLLLGFVTLPTPIYPVVGVSNDAYFWI